MVINIGLYICGEARKPNSTQMLIHKSYVAMVYKCLCRLGLLENQLLEV